MTTWFLLMFSLHMLAAEHATGVVQVVKFANLPACETARGVGTSDDGVMTVCTSEDKGVQGFITAMNCQESKVDKLGDGTDVARFTCAPQFGAPDSGSAGAQESANSTSAPAWSAAVS